MYNDGERCGRYLEHLFTSILHHRRFIDDIIVNLLDVLGQGTYLTNDIKQVGHGCAGGAFGKATSGHEQRCFQQEHLILQYFFLYLLSYF